MASPLKSPGSPPSDGSRRVPPAPSPRPVLASALLAPPWSPAVITDRSRSCPLRPNAASRHSLTGVLSGGNGGPCSRVIPAGTQAQPGWVPLGGSAARPKGVFSSAFQKPLAHTLPCREPCLSSAPLRPGLYHHHRRLRPRRRPHAFGTRCGPRGSRGGVLSQLRPPRDVSLGSSPSAPGTVLLLRLLQLSPLPHEAFMALALSPAASCPAPLLPALTARSRRLRPPGLRGSEGPISASSPSVPSGSLGPDSAAGGAPSCGSVTSVPDLPRRAPRSALSPCPSLSPALPPVETPAECRRPGTPRGRAGLSPEDGSLSGTHLPRAHVTGRTAGTAPESCGAVLSIPFRSRQV